MQLTLIYITRTSNASVSMHVNFFSETLLKIVERPKLTQLSTAQRNYLYCHLCLLSYLTNLAIVSSV